MDLNELRRLAEDAEPHHPLWPFCDDILALLNRLRDAEAALENLRSRVERTLPDDTAVTDQHLVGFHAGHRAAVSQTLDDITAMLFE